MWAIVLVAGIALVMCGAIVWALGLSSVSADATNRLEHSRDRIRQLAADRQDPSSGQPLEDVSAVLRTHIQRTAEGRGEAELGFVGTDASTKLTWVSADNVSFRPEEDKELLTRVTSQAAASESVIETVRTPASSYRVLVVPLQGGSQHGALVHVIDLKVAESQLRRTMAFYAAAAVFTVALVTGLAWFAVERLLRPIEQLRRATESIGEEDLTTRVPVKGRDDLTALAEAVNRMLDRVQTSVEAQRNLLDDVGHELRTPIAVVRGHLELTDPADPEDVRQTQLLAIDELDRMGMLVGADPASLLLDGGVGSAVGALGIVLMVVGHLVTRRLIRAATAEGEVVDEALVLDLAAAALSAGASVPGVLIALGAALEEEGAGVVGRALLLGAPWEEAWQAPEDDRWRARRSRLESCLRPGWEDGASPAALLAATAASLRAGRHARDEEAAERLAVRLVLPLGACHLPAFVILGIAPVVASVGMSMLTG